MKAGPSGHLGPARHPTPQGGPQDDGGGGRSGRGRRGLWSHHEANTGRPSVRPVPIQGSYAESGVDIRPCYGYFTIKYFSEYEYEATLTQ